MKKFSTCCILFFLALGFFSSCKDSPKGEVDVRNDSNVQISYELISSGSVKYSGKVDRHSKVTIEDFEDGEYTLKYWPYYFNDHYRSFYIKDEDVVVVGFNPLKGGWHAYVTERYQ